MQSLMTTLLDALGVMLLAAGAAAALFVLIGWAALAAAGFVLLAGSWLAERAAERRQ